MLVRKAATVAVAAVLVPCSGLLVSCSGGGTKPPPPAPTTTSSTVPAIVSVNKTVNSGGFLVDILTADAQSTRGVVTMKAAVTNTLPAPQEFNPTFTMSASGRTYDGTSAKTPTITAGATVPVELDVPVDPTFTIDEAVLIFGNSTKNQATVPLGHAGKYVALLDAPAVPPAPVTAGQQAFTFSAAVVSSYRYDGTELDAGTAELVLTVSVANHDPRYSYAVDSSTFRFVTGAETLNSGVVKVASVNAGGAIDHAVVYADVDRYKPGATVTLTVVGTDAAQTNVTQVASITLPNLG